MSVVSGVGGVAECIYLFGNQFHSIRDWMTMNYAVGLGVKHEGVLEKKDRAL